MGYMTFYYILSPSPISPSIIFLHLSNFHGIYLRYSVISTTKIPYSLDLASCTHEFIIYYALYFAAFHGDSQLDLES